MLSEPLREGITPKYHRLKQAMTIAREIFQSHDLFARTVQYNKMYDIMQCSVKLNTGCFAWPSQLLSPTFWCAWQAPDWAAPWR